MQTKKENTVMMNDPKGGSYRTVPGSEKTVTMKESKGGQYRTVQGKRVSAESKGIGTPQKKAPKKRTAKRPMPKQF
jgi:hypothetical protein